MKNFNPKSYPITPITNESTYQLLCDLAEELDDLCFEDIDQEGAKNAHVEAVATLIEAYENKNFKFNSITLTVPQIMEQAMEQLNITRKDLSLLLGANRVSEILSGKRSLTLNQIRILHREFKIPTNLLIGV